MSAPSATTDAWRELLDAPRAPSQHPAWLAGRRDHAVQQFRRTGWPTRRDEAWQTTDVSPVTRTGFRPRGESPIDAEAAEALLASLPPLEAAARLVFVDGALVPALSRVDALPNGLTVAPLGDALTRDPSALEAALGTLVDGDEHAFAALNTALWSEGALVRVDAQVDLERPVHLVFFTDTNARATLACPRILVQAKAASRLSLVETWIGADGAGAPRLVNGAVEIWLDEGAHVERLEIQDQPNDVFHIQTLAAHVGRDASLASTCLTFGAATARNGLRVRLADEGASCRLDGLSIVDAAQRADHQIEVIHAQPHGTSQQHYKGILDGSASVAFAGSVRVRPQAQKTDARQANHNLLLSDEARADSKPQLEIFADDVKCAHGATVGQLDDEAIFYLRSRGVDEAAARRLLLHAFAGEIPGRIEDERLREHAARYIGRSLPEDVL